VTGGHEAEFVRAITAHIYSSLGGGEEGTQIDDDWIQITKVRERVKDNHIYIYIYMYMYVYLYMYVYR